MREYHILNLGAGVQSTTLYLMACRDQLSVLPMTQGADGIWRYSTGLPVRRVAFDLAIFADTQDEPVPVYEHLAWLESLKGPPIIRVTAGRLGDDLVRGKNTTGGRFAAIPAFTSPDNGVTVGRTRRQCSKEYKTEPIERAIRRDVLGLKPRQRVSRRTLGGTRIAHFANGEEVHVNRYFGISHDERSRATRIFELFLEKPAYSCHFPLVDRMMTRANCIEWLEAFGNVPHEVPRSACVYCPFHTDAEWARLKSRNGADWERAVEIDTALRTSGAVANRDMTQTMYLHRSCKPLVEIEFHPREDKTQLGFGIECEGVCGV